MNLFNYEDPARQAEAGDGLILRGLSDSDWKSLMEFLDKLQFPAGAKILRMGESDRTLYFLQSGQVNVVVDSPRSAKIIATIGAGSVFGELAFFDGGPRAASIHATADCELLALSHQAFAKLSLWHPRIARELLMELGRVISARLRRVQARG